MIWPVKKTRRRAARFVVQVQYVPRDRGCTPSPGPGVRRRGASILNNTTSHTQLVDQCINNYMSAAYHITVLNKWDAFRVLRWTFISDSFNVRRYVNEIYVVCGTSNKLSYIKKNWPIGRDSSKTQRLCANIKPYDINVILKTVMSFSLVYFLYILF